jgi:peptide/nickel transport system substrate-binding protein
LRRGVRWQDGQPVTSADVAFTFAKITDPSVNSPGSAPYTHVAQLTTPDDHTVVVRLKTPWAPAIGQLFCSGENGSIVPKHLLEHSTDFNRDPFGLHPVGSGAMRLARWDRGSRIVLVPNADYFGGAPKIRELDILIVPDTNTLLTMLFAGELDAVVTTASNQLEKLRSLQGYSVQLAPYPQVSYLAFNVTRPPFADQRLRASLALAVDRQRLVSTAYVGTAIAADSFIPPFSWAYEPNNGSPQYDPGLARQSLTQDGWLMAADGVRTRGDQKLAFTLSINSGSPRAAATAQEIQQAWRAVGADVSIKALPLNVLYSPTGILTTGKFDVALQNFIQDPDPDRSSTLGSQFTGTRGANSSGYTSTTSDALAAQAASAYAHAARKPLYARLQRLWNRDLPVLPIAWPEAIYVVNSDLHGFKPEPVNSDFWNIQDWSD